MGITSWLTDNYIEAFGAVTGIIYVFLEIRQNLWLWPVGIITSAVYIWIFFTGKLYADMSLQVYYLVISILGWYWWVKGSGLRAQGAGQEEMKGRRGEGEKGRKSESSTGELPSLESLPRDSGGSEVGSEGTEKLKVSRLKLKTGVTLTVIFIVLYTVMWFILDRLTDSPVPEWDSFITSLSIIATWMLARKIFEHWYLWIVVNTVASVLFFSRGLYPTLMLYIIYGIMSFTGLRAWKKTLI
jgi:nicotinamide mononucleotide transporter